LATHSWALLVAFFVMALAPLGFRHPIAEVDATSAPIGVTSRTAVDHASIATAVPTQAGQLNPPVLYRVKSQDTVDSIAARAGITVPTLLQVNDLSSATVSPGEHLVVPPVDGTIVRVDPDQSLVELSQTYRIDIGALRSVNGLGVDTHLPGYLFIPASQTDAVAQGPAVATATGQSTDPSGHEQLVRFGWPTRGTLTQPFWALHPGIDIANDVGTPEVASDGGRVVFAGWGDYGIYVEIDHGNGFHTVYGHMSQVSVTTGQQVVKGQLVGLMGATGRATGPHLHFEIRYHGVPQNPLDLLS
jgi:murein DD-endopeptidase MepM/ murein hydrolase activator NlpD